MFTARSAAPSRGAAATAVAASSTGSTSPSASPGSSATMHQLPQANAQGANRVPAAPAISSNGTASSVGDARRGGVKNAAFDDATTHTSPHHRSARDSCVDTEGSGSAAGTVTTATAATASRHARHATPAPAGSLCSDQAVRQQRQRGTTSSTATPPDSSRALHHSDADIARVRAALAEAGYPDPSWDDIECVFAHLSVNHNDGPGNAAAGHRETAPSRRVPHLSRRVVPEDMTEGGQRPAHYHHNHSAVITSPPVSLPQQRQQGGCPTESSALLHYLDPSLRLQRYIQLRERELEELCLRPSLGAVHPQQQPSSPVPAAHALGTALIHNHDDAPPASQVKASSVRGAAGERAGKQQPRVRRGGGAVGATAAASRDAQMRVTAAHYRRAANIVFDATGDQRFRFFPTTRTPQGTGTLFTAMPVPRTSSSSTSTTSALTGVATARSVGPASSLGSYRNYYHCPRLNSCGIVGGQVSYLDPEGRTLRRKADPVKRGEQMRLLWAKDSFLSQRGRPREAWRTRQITMAYGQGADGGTMHDG